jgi:adenine-specific DNA-methyltransferase
MPINADKPHLWKADVEKSIDFYNDWFLRFAPETYRTQRAITAKSVTTALKQTKFLLSVTPEVLKGSPEILPILRMTCAPPIARDRLMGLAYANKNLIASMEGKPGHPPRIPPQMKELELDEQLNRICEILFELADRDLFPWLKSSDSPGKSAIARSATVVADRLCGATADPIIRNAQEQRQLSTLQSWLESKGYEYVSAKGIDDVANMKPGTFTFRLNITVGKGTRKVNIPIDTVIQPMDDELTLPILIEAKSAGDATNTNKRRKEEAQKFSQLKKHFGDISFILFLCGYFEPGYLGYEASEGIDWVWEHRISDFDAILQDNRSKKKVCESSVSYAGPNEKKEIVRHGQQLRIDQSRSQQDRNILGQFSTPFPLAREIVAQTQNYLCAETISFLEPAVGSGVFFSALSAVASRPVEKATGVEIDKEYAQVAQDTWGHLYTVIHDDFLKVSTHSEIEDQFNCLCANPPYVRHHHMTGELKRELQQRVERELGIQVSGLSGLYVYFILLAHRLLAEGAVASWLIPSEFMCVNYGQALREYLLRHVTLLQVHRFRPDDVQFNDALVSSCVITYQKRKPKAPYTFIFSSGGSLCEPATEQNISSDDPSLTHKWNTDTIGVAQNESSVRIGDLFEIKRGIATGANGFFVIGKEIVKKYDIPRKFLKSLLPGPRYLKSDVVTDAGNGEPAVERTRYLLDCDLPPEELHKSHPGLWSYIQEGIARGISDCYICSHRKLWYLQEQREPPLFLTTYMGRSSAKNSNPFRFILNRSDAIATNVYIYLYPRPFLKKLLDVNTGRAESLHQMLNRLTPKNLIQNGRTYGGGLHKLEPKELAGMPLSELPDWLHIQKKTQTSLPLTFE